MKFILGFIGILIMMAYPPTIFIFIAFFVYSLYKKNNNAKATASKPINHLDVTPRETTWSYSLHQKPYTPKPFRPLSEKQLAGRVIAFDTETTGFSHEGGDRIVEIGCVEYINGKATGQVFQTYLNPNMKISQSALSIYQKTNEFFHDKPQFYMKADEFLAFISKSPLISHYASFDMGFINYELTHVGFDPIPKSRFHCSLKLARHLFQGQSNKLDDVCQRLDIDLSRREIHGAIIDAEFSAEAYFKMVKMLK